MLKTFCTLVTLLILSPLATAEIFKCQGENGKTVYQNFRCDIDSIGSQATAAPPPEQKFDPASDFPSRKPAANRAATPEKAGPSGVPPRIGMTKKEVKASTWGDPIDIVKEEVVEGWTQAWYYDLNKKRSVMFNERGIVTEVTQ